MPAGGSRNVPQEVMVWLMAATFACDEAFKQTPLQGLFGKVACKSAAFKGEGPVSKTINSFKPSC